MAYNSGWNPDALPAHAEPDQAAQILSQQEHLQHHTQQPNNQKPLPAIHDQQTDHPDGRKYSASGGHGGPPLRTSPRPHQYSDPNPPPQRPYGERYDSRNNSYSSKASPNYNNNAPGPYGPSPPGGGGRMHSGSQSWGQSPLPPAGSVGGQRHSSPPSRPPPTPAPVSKAGGADPSLFPLFQAVDKHGTGHLTERELGKALVNGDFTQFDSHTVKMMIRMFDVDRNGSINFDEFSALWGFLAAWRGLFDRFDEDQSGNISFDEYTHALVAFGYRLSSNFVHILYATYDKSGEGRMSFDLFVQSCIILKRMTDVFKKYDEDRDGFITLSFEEFLTEILRQR